MEIAGQFKHLELRFVIGAHDPKWSCDVNDRGGVVEDLVWAWSAVVAFGDNLWQPFQLSCGGSSVKRS